MAGINLISAAAAALFVLAFISNISYTEGRLLSMEHPGGDPTGNLHRKIFETAAVAPLKSRPPAFRRTPIAPNDVEVQGGDFRPTTPGHSPGAGHSVAPESHVDSKIH